MRVCFWQANSNPFPARTHAFSSQFYRYDDHEVENDFEGGLSHPLARQGLEKYVAYWGQRNPGRPRDLSALYYSFDYGGLATVFVMDSRLNANWTSGEMLGAKQFAAVEAFLRRAKKLHFKFILLASPLSWSEDGHGSYFAPERKRLLDLITIELDLCNVIVIAGDMHYGSAHRYRHRVLEVSASPFQGWPFWPYEHLKSTEDQRGYDRLFIHGGAFFFGRLELFAGTKSQHGSDGVFTLYSWNMWWPQSVTPSVKESLPFNVTCGR